MNDKEHSDILREMNHFFSTGAIFDANPEVFRRYLGALGHLINADDLTSQQALLTRTIQCLTINHIQMARAVGEMESTIKRLNTENDKVARRVCWLTVAAVVFGSIQAFGVFWTIFH